jgi:uncharacterized protein with HEPN domain
MTEKEKEIRDKADLKCFNFLNELYNILQYTNKVQLGTFVQKMGVTSYYYKVLINEGILEVKGEVRKSNYTLKWAGIAPTREMALKVRKEAYLLLKEKRDARKAKEENSDKIVKNIKEEVKVTPVLAAPIVSKKVETKKQTKSKKFSLLWGALSFEY